MRCLDPVSRHLEVDVQELWTHQGRDAGRPAPAGEEAEETDELPRLEGDLLDLEPVLRDAVVLALPLQPLCRDDCPGLCPECGARLADDPGHQHEALDPRWAALRPAAGTDGQLTRTTARTRTTDDPTTDAPNRGETARGRPKRKMSRSNTRSRRAQWKTTAAPLAPCKRCREPKLAHVACPTCGTYNDRDVLDV